MAQAARAQRLLRKAVTQFMPRSFNVIVLVGRDAEQVRAIDQALLGTVVEAWDRFPPRGERVAHGRADDGFWSHGRSNASRAVAWMLMPGAPLRRRTTANAPDAPHCALWLRSGSSIPPRVRLLLQELFAEAPRGRAPTQHASEVA